MDELHLRRVVIRGYRSIVKADLRLGRITVVIGPSDSGKSAFVRALRDWAGNARGVAFMTEGRKTTRVGVAVGRRHKVVWEKIVQGNQGGGQSRYVVADSDGEQVSYEKIGLGVPEEVSDITGIRPVEIDDLKINVNFALQDKPWFMLSNPPWTPAAVTKVIGRISGIDALILANRDLVNRRNWAAKTAKDLTAQIEVSRVGLLEFDGLDAAEKILVSAELLSEKIGRDRQKLGRSAQHLRKLRDLSAGLARARRLVGPVQAVVDATESTGIVEKLDRLQRAEASVAKLAKLTARVKSSKQQVELARGRLEGCCDLLEEIAKDRGLACPLCSQPAHPGCRKAIAIAAKAARDAERA